MNCNKELSPVTAVVVGFGDRAEIYSRYSLIAPKELKIVAVVDPNKIRRDLAKKLFDIPEEFCFTDISQVLEKGKIADCIINGTMDNLHIQTTLPFLKQGYDVLLEKPITADKTELETLVKEVEKYKNKVVICHVLRYTPFYKKIKEIINSGKIGEIKHIETTENVGFCHASISYIRGKWNNKDKCGSSYMLAKCCHDTDLLVWLNDKSKPIKVHSFGNKKYWIKEKAPLGSGNRCLVDCKIEKECPFSAKKMYLDNNPMPITVWADRDKHYEDLTYEEKEHALKTDSPFGVCIYKTDANIVDQQTVTVEFSDGSTAYHSLISGCARAGRRIKIYGTYGEIEGFTEDASFVVRTYNPQNILFNEEKVDIKDDVAGDNHYGGDRRIMEDFVRVMRGQKPSISTSSLDCSVLSHLLVYSADESMETNKIVYLKDKIN